MMNNDYDSEESSLADDIRTARQLFYPDIVIEKLKEAPNKEARIRILTDARHGVYDKYIRNSSGHMGDEIKRRRLDKGVTIKDLAAVSGFAASTVRAYEIGIRTLTKDTYNRLLVALDLL